MHKKLKAVESHGLHITRITNVKESNGVVSFEASALVEGLTKGRDKVYTAKAIEGAISKGVYNGKPMFLNHSTFVEDMERPERDVKDMVARITASYDTAIEGKKAVGVRAVIHGSPTIPAEDVRSWLKNMEASGQSAELSHHAFLDGHDSEQDGMPVFVVDEIVEVRSVDFVTEGNTRAKVSATEAAKAKADKLKKEGGTETMTPEELAKLFKEKPELFGGIVESIKTQVKAELNKSDEIKAAQEAQKVAEEKAKTAEDKLAEKELGEKKAELIDKAKKLVADSKLPEVSQKKIIEGLEKIEITSETESIEDEAKEAIDAEKKYVSDLAKDTKEAVVFNNDEDESGEEGKESIDGLLGSIDEKKLKRRIKP